MNPVALIKTPWDAAAFGLDTYELVDASVATLQLAIQTPGHHTVRIDPLASTRLLHEHGFYYCDTLIEPHCVIGNLRVVTHPDSSISKDVEWEALLSICHGTFIHGRFHRDFNIDRSLADIRYDNWLRQLYDSQSVYGLFWGKDLAGFIAHTENSLVLHAVAPAYRGKGLAKYWWGAVCSTLRSAGFSEIKSSVSAANVAALNLYISLGFSFRNPLDVYHRLVK